MYTHTTWWKYGWKSLRHQVYHPPTLNRTPPFSRFLSSSQCWGLDGWMEWVFDRSPVAQWPAPSGKPLYFQATAQLLPQRAVPTDSDSKVGKTNTNKTAISFWARTDHQTCLHRMARLFTAPCFGHMIHPQRTEPSQQMGSLESWRQFTQQSHTLIYPWTDWFTTFLQLKRQLFSWKIIQTQGFQPQPFHHCHHFPQFPFQYLPAIGSDSIC